MLNFISFFDDFQVGYDHLALAVDFEFPQQATSISSNATSEGGKGGGKQEKKANKKEARQAVSIPCAKVYKLPKYLQDRLDSCSRRVKIYSRLTVKIRPADINTQLHHLVSTHFFYLKFFFLLFSVLNYKNFEFLFINNKIYEEK